MTATPSRRGHKATRRSSATVRSQLIAAAREIFAERGYAGASTMAISRRADVTEALLFRHFGSKNGLFDASILEPFETFVDAYTEKWTGHRVGEKSQQDLVRDFVEVLYGFFEENQGIVDALLASRAHLDSVAIRLEEQFERLQVITVEATREFGLPVEHFAVATRLSFGLIMSATVHSRLLFPADYGTPRAILIDQISGFLLNGIRMLDRGSA